MFNGAEKEIRETCRSCNAPKPISDNAIPEDECLGCGGKLSRLTGRCTNPQHDQRPSDAIPDGMFDALRDVAQAAIVWLESRHVRLPYPGRRHQKTDDWMRHRDNEAALIRAIRRIPTPPLAAQRSAEATPPPTREWLNETWLELRASLEGALIFVDQIGRRDHPEECDSYNACHNAECDCPAEDDDGAELVTHETRTCTCLTYDAISKAKDIRAVLARTGGLAGPRREADRSSQATK